MFQHYVYLPSSVAAINPASPIVISYDTHPINCVLDDLPGQYTGVEWILGTSVTSLGLAPQDGVISGTSQTSTLSLSSAQLVQLKAAGGNNPSHVITCRIIVGTSSTAITATQTMSIYTPGKTLDI